MDADASSGALRRAKFNAETARIRWSELQRAFAQGRVVDVALDLDLIDVAEAVSDDATATVKVWMDGGRLGPLSDTAAGELSDTDAEVWALVVAPWVLIQRIAAD